MSPRVIKANQVTLLEGVQVIDVPSKNYFNPNVNHNMSRPEEGFRQADFGSGEKIGEQEADDFVDPEMVVEMAEQEAEKIIKDAKNEADLIIQKAKLHIEEEKEKAREEGRTEGFAQGSEEAKQTHEQLLLETEQTLEQTREEKEAAIAAIEPEMVNLIIDIAGKLVGDALVLNPQVILHIIKTGVQKVSGASELTIRVSKDDFEIASGMKDVIMQNVDSDTVVSIVKDTALSGGDCIIDTPIGSIDSSLDKQWQSLKNDLIMILKEQRFGY